MPHAAAQIVPHDAAIVIVVDDKAVSDDQQTCLRLCGMPTASGSRQTLHGACLVGASACTLVCLLSAAQSLEWIDADAPVLLGRVAVLVLAYVLTWLVLKRVYRWMNST